MRTNWRGAWTESLLFLAAAASFLLGWSLTEPPPPTFGLEPPSEGALRVVTWNVGGSAEGGRPLGDELVARVASTLSEIQADLIALQEIRSEQQISQLVQRMGGDWQAFLASGEGSRVGMMVRRGDLRARSWPGNSRFVLASYRPPRHLLPKSADSPVPGDSGADGQGERRRGGFRNSILIAVLHADAFSAEKRNQSIGAAADLLQRFPAPRLLLGDLNIDPGLDKRQDLFSNDEHLDVESYNYLAERLQDAGQGGGSTAEPDRRLDYIFFSREHFELLEAGPLKGRRWGDMDHDPLIADLRPRR
ncbi:MAG TPA: endonuclease/exonuclease/phosphatase family protein [Acidobacteriota bacterium]|nr:endonuclease/exonuclease/phosphatase family protein [Acidobacteriota bacterium]